MSATNSSGEAMLPSSMRDLTVLYRHGSASTATRRKDRRGGQARSEQLASLAERVECAVLHVHVQEGAATHSGAEQTGRRVGAIAHGHAPEVHRPRDDGMVVMQPQCDSVDWRRKNPRLLQTRKRTRDPRVGRAYRSEPRPRAGALCRATSRGRACAPAGRQSNLLLSNKLVDRHAPFAPCCFAHACGAVSRHAPGHLPSKPPRPWSRPRLPLPV